MTIVDWINQLLVHKKNWDEYTEDEQKKFSPFIINRWLSMDKDFIEIVNIFQKYAIGTLEPREVYKWYCDILPRNFITMERIYKANAKPGSKDGSWGFGGKQG